MWGMHVQDFYIKRCIKSPFHFPYKSLHKKTTTHKQPAETNNLTKGSIISFSINIYSPKRRRKKNKIYWNLAAPAHSKCSSLACSCYVASRNSDSKEEESIRDRTSFGSRKRPHNVGGRRRSREGALFMKSSKGIDNDRKIEISNGVEVELEAASTPLKSNLKKSSSMVEMRKVSWSDSHGRDIAHVQEFEPSEEGELARVGNSCKCVIQ